MFWRWIDRFFVFRMSFAIFEQSTKLIESYIQLSSQHVEKNIHKYKLLFFLLLLVRRYLWIRSALLQISDFDKFCIMQYAEILFNDYQFRNLSFLFEQWTVVSFEKTSNLKSKLFTHAACEWSHRRNSRFRISLPSSVMRWANK